MARMTRRAREDQLFAGRVRAEALVKALGLPEDQITIHPYASLRLDDSLAVTVCIPVLTIEQCDRILTALIQDPMRERE